MLLCLDQGCLLVGDSELGAQGYGGEASCCTRLLRHRQLLRKSHEKMIESWSNFPRNLKYDGHYQYSISLSSPVRVVRIMTNNPVYHTG
jgi:hypothetical protein